MLLPLRINLESDPPIVVDVLNEEPIPGYYTSTVMPCQLPEFVGLEHPLFVDFMRTYYEWMERGVTHGGTGAGEIRVSHHLQSYKDTDECIDVFFDAIRNEFMESIPKTLWSGLNEKTLLKNIKSFYTSKGTPQSIEFLLRILYNEYAEVYEPKVDIIKASGGEYSIGNQILVSPNHGASIYESEGTIVQQFHPETGKREASAGVDRVTRFIGHGYDFFALNIVSPSGNFDEDLPLSIPTNTIAISETILPAIDSITAITGGSYYAIGDLIEMVSNRGRGGRAYVSGVDIDGSINSIEFLDRGINFNTDDTITSTITTKNGTGAVFGATGGATNHPTRGYYLSDNGLLSSTNKLQDNYYYQDFSYVIRSELPITNYRDAIKKLVHPSGYALFGDLLLKADITIPSSVEGITFQFETPLIGHYTPFNLSTWENLRSNSNSSTDLFPYGFSGDLESTYDESGTVVHSLGASGALGGTGGNPGTTGTNGTTVGNNPLYDQLVHTAGDSATADYWLIYPHPNTRTIAGTSYGGGETHEGYPKTILYTQNPNGTSFEVGDYVFQLRGKYLPEAQGVVLLESGWNTGQKLTVEQYTDSPFAVSSIDMGDGSTSGLLTHGGSGGNTWQNIHVVDNPNESTNTTTGATSDFRTLNVRSFTRKITG